MAASMEKEGRGSCEKKLKGETSRAWKFTRCELLKKKKEPRMRLSDRNCCKNRSQSRGKGLPRMGVSSLLTNHIPFYLAHTWILQVHQLLSYSECLYSVWLPRELLFILQSPAQASPPPYSSNESLTLLHHFQSHAQPSASFPTSVKQCIVWANRSQVCPWTVQLGLE